MEKEALMRASESAHGGQTTRTPGVSAQSGTHNRFLIKLTVISTLGGLLFGYDTGVISGALLYMKAALNLTTFSEAIVVSSLLFPGAACGALLGGKLADKLGRKGSLLVCAGLFFVGALICATAPNVAIMTIGRIILGFGVGAAAATCPLYLAEMAPAHRRGRMVTIQRADDRDRSVPRVRDERAPRCPHQGPARVAVDAQCRDRPGGRTVRGHVLPPGLAPLVRGPGPARGHPTRPGSQP